MIRCEGESVDRNHVTYVAVGTNVNEGKSLLKWAVKSFAQRKICLLHVHKPTILVSLFKGKLSESKLKKQAFKACQELEQKKIQKLMNHYFLFLSKMGIQADKVSIETSNVEEGIVQLILQHRISCLVMGAAADAFFSRNTSESNSSKAITVCQKAPLSCHIWFICKEVLVHSRPAVSESEFHLTTTETSPSSIDGCGALLNHKPEEYSAVSTENVCFENSTRSIKGAISPLDYSTEMLSCEDGSPLLEEASFPESLSCSSSNSSWDYQIHKKETSDLGGKLEHAMSDVEKLKQILFEQSLKRWRAEEDAIDAVHTAEGAERQCNEERIRRQDFESRLTIQNQEIQSMKDQYDRCSNEFQLIQDQKPALENRLSKAHHIEKELEDKIIQAVNLLITLKDSRDTLQTEYNSAVRRVNKLTALSREDPSGISSTHFFGISFSDIIDATQNFNPSYRIGRGRNTNIFKGIFNLAKVAIKMLPFSGSQSDSEFKHEVEVLSRVRHPNLVMLIGACPESRALVYEYIENGSLEDYLSGVGKTVFLPFQTRISIAIEICCTLIFLQANQTYSIHGNLKPSKILLDPNFVTKISDLGAHDLVPLNSTSHGNIDPEISAYIDPEILENGVLTTKSDVYSFGIILLRLLTARPAMSVARDVKCALERGSLDSVLDMSAGDWPLEPVKQVAGLALRCCEKNPLDRPDLVSEVWAVLESLKGLRNLAESGYTSHCLDSRNQLKVPSHFLCPIFQEVMKDPCVAPDGFTYEADAIKGWFDSGHKTSPMTNLKLENCDLLPNYALYHAIKEWQLHS